MDEITNQHTDERCEVNINNGVKWRCVVPVKADRVDDSLFSDIFKSKNTK